MGEDVGAAARARNDGTYRIVLAPEELIEKLAALVPPPRLNLVRYHGILAPNAADRAQIVPGPKEVACEVAPCPDAEPTPAQRRHRVAWAELLRRVFRVDVTVCPACGGHMKIVAALTEPRSIHAYLEGVGLPSRAPPIAPARPHPQPEPHRSPDHDQRTHDPQRHRKASKAA